MKAILILEDDEIQGVISKIFEKEKTGGWTNIEVQEFCLDATEDGQKFLTLLANNDGKLYLEDAMTAFNTSNGYVLAGVTSGLRRLAARMGKEDVPFRKKTGRKAENGEIQRYWDATVDVVATIMETIGR
jgi:hypothetical protein